MLMERALQLIEELPCLADAHLHLLDGWSLDSFSRLLRSEYNVGLGVVVEVQPPVERVASLPRRVLDRAWDASVGVIERLAPWLLEHYDSVDRLFAETILFLQRFQPVPPGGYEGPGARLLVFSDPMPSLGGEALERGLERLSLGARGLKLITTIHMVRMDSEGVEAVFEAASSRGGIVLAHAGCDPGLWELPPFCGLGDPRGLDSLARRYRDVDIIIAHVGGYSAVAPGVYTREAVDLARRHPNVYLDTSAVPYTVLHIAVKELGGLAAEKLVHGSDYPVVEGDDPGKSAARAAAVMLAEGYGRGQVERVLYRNLEELLGVGCG